MTNPLIVIGETTADEICTAAARMPGAPWSRIEKCFFHAREPTQKLAALAKQYPQADYILGIADVRLRLHAAETTAKLGWRLAAVIDPTAFVDPTARVSPGCFVAAQSVVSQRAVLEESVLVHFHVTVGHDARIGAHSVLLPGARISGLVKLGHGVLVGSNAFIYQGIEVGQRAQIDALTYVRDNVPPHRTVSGRRPEA